MTPWPFDITVIIPAYNSEKHLDRCLDSVKAALVDDIKIEIIIVNDGSTDTTGKIADDFSKGRPFVKVIHQNNAGLSEARNAAIKIAQGRYIYFLDSDDTVFPDTFSRLWKHVEKHPSVDMVYGQTQVTDSGNVELLKFLNLKDKHAREFDDSKRVRKVHLRLPEIACNKLIKTKFLIDNGLFFKPGLIHEDFHWHLRAYECVKSYAVEFGTPTYLYFSTHNSITDSQTVYKKRRVILDILTEIVPTLKTLDSPVMRLITDMMVYYYPLAETEQDRLQYDNLINTILEHPSSGLKHRILTKIFKIYPKSIPVRPLLWLI